MKFRSILACAVASLAASGCATIVAKSSQTITVTSVPDAASVNIVNKSGTPVHSGTTPITVTLKKGRGYFKPESYTVRFAKDGYQAREVTVRGEVNGWYFGNVIFGGLIGLLAVDPATGAMYTLKPAAVGATLDSLKVSRTDDGHSLTVILLASIPQQQRDQLVPISSN
jgi:hypothetical protein